MPLRANACRAPLACALAAALFGCEPAVAPEGAPLRVISLAPSATRIVRALGAEEALVAVDERSHALAGLERVPSVGGLFNPDLERTVELRPTLVLAVRSAQQEGYLEELRRRGVHVEELAGHTLEDVLQSFETIGRLVGRPAEGQALAGRVRAELRAVAERAAPLPRRSVVLIVEREPLYVAGGGSFAQALIEAAGGSNAFADLDDPYPLISLEALAARAPEVLIDATVAPTGEGAADASAARAYWEHFDFVRRVELLPPGLATIPGPELAQGARELLARIHPDVASEATP